MYVIARDRQQGKTTTLIDWLLDGHIIAEYPGWSRVIVCVTDSEVVRVTGLLRSKTIPLVGKYRDTDLTNIRKCIWTIRDLAAVLIRHNSDIEVAIDNADMLITQLIGHPVAAVSMTGKACAPLGMVQLTVERYLELYRHSLFAAAYGEMIAEMPCDEDDLIDRDAINAAVAEERERLANSGS